MCLVSEVEVGVSGTWVCSGCSGDSRGADPKVEMKQKNGWQKVIGVDCGSQVDVRLIRHLWTAMARQHNFGS